MKLEEENKSDDVERRLRKITEAIAARKQAIKGTKVDEGMACPIDPTERELCDGCQ